MKAIVTVNGIDRIGIIAEVSKKLAELNININDIKQTTLENQFTMIMMVDIRNCKCSFIDIAKELNKIGNKMAIEISIRNKEIFDTMHNI